MSSALRHLSQIEPHVRFLRTIQDALGEGDYTRATDASMNAFLAASTTSGSGLNTVAIEGATSLSTSEGSTYTLVRDLGRRVTIVSSASGNPVTAVWIQVQGVNGSGAEGVPDNANYGTFWIPTFYADTDDGNIQWARLG
jgi:hypothetical protein